MLASQMHLHIHSSTQNGRVCTSHERQRVVKYSEDQLVHTAVHDWGRRITPTGPDRLRCIAYGWRFGCDAILVSPLIRTGQSHPPSCRYRRKSHLGCQPLAVPSCLAKCSPRCVRIPERHHPRLNASRAKASCHICRASTSSIRGNGISSRFVFPQSLYDRYMSGPSAPAGYSARV